MYVKFFGCKEICDLHVTLIRPGLVKLSGELPEERLTAGFELLTKKGSRYGNYQDYTTVYQRMDDGSIILSNDGSVYVPPEPTEPQPVPEPEPPTLEEVKEEKRQEISTACEQSIYSGITVMMPEGMEHFSLTEKDQLNLFGKQAQLASGAERLEYHQDGHPCRYYTAAEMQMIIVAATEHVSYHTTYCNSLNMWIAGVEDVEELTSIFYGVDVPEEYQSEVLKDYLAKIMEEPRKEVEENETVS